MASLLERHGYATLCVRSGAMALMGVRHNSPDLVLLDIRMPEMDGYEVCRRLKAVPESRDIPIIFMSAFSDAADRVRAFDMGGVDYITKPFQVPEVLNRVQSQLSIRQLRRQLAVAQGELAHLAAATACDLQRLSEQRAPSPQALGRLAQAATTYQEIQPQPLIPVALASLWPQGADGTETLPTVLGQPQLLRQLLEQVRSHLQDCGDLRLSTQAAELQPGTWQITLHAQGRGVALSPGLHRAVCEKILRVHGTDLAVVAETDALQLCFTLAAAGSEPPAG